MFRPLLLSMLIAGLLLGAACTRRMAPFSPHLPRTEAHQAVAANSDCLKCHDIAGLPDHKPADDCRRCHRILPGD